MSRVKGRGLETESEKSEMKNEKLKEEKRRFLNGVSAICAISPRALCARLVSALKEAKMFEEAAVVLRDYLDDVEEGIAALVEGSRWAEADRLIMRENRTDLCGEQH